MPQSKFFIISGIVLLVILLFFKTQLPTSSQEISQSNTTSPPTSSPLPPPSGSISSSRQSNTNLEDFAILKADDGEYEFQLDVRKSWQPTVQVSSGDVVEFTATGIVCGGVNIGCTGPNGQDGPAMTSRTGDEEFPLGEAWCQALIARVGSKMFQVGEHKVYQVPIGVEDEDVELMTNFRLPYLKLGTGGFRVKVKITKNR